MSPEPLDPSAPQPGDVPEGTMVGRYRLAEVVGRGGMGTVYRAFDTETKREVALKMLKPGMPEDLRQRFLAECEAEARIRHPHVMPVYDRGCYEEDRLYFVMELLYEPITLTDFVQTAQKGALGATWPRLRHWADPVRFVQEVFVPLCEGVDAANRTYGIIHRDLKPDNVLLDVRTRRTYLIDFGICVRGEEEEPPGKILGTPRFLSPEQAQGRVNPRTDVWGLGALLHFVLTGAPPIESSSPFHRDERARRIEALEEARRQAEEAGDAARVAELAARLEALADPDLRTVEDMVRDARAGRYRPLPERIDPALRAILLKATALDPEARYESAGALAADLSAWSGGGRVRALVESAGAGAAVHLAGRTIRRHLVTAAWAALGLLVGLVLGAALLGGAPPSRALEAADVASRVAALEADVDAFSNGAAGLVEGALAWEALEDRAVALAGRLERVAEEAGSAGLGERLERISRRLARPRVRVDAPPGTRWVAEGAALRRSVLLRPGVTAAMEPGAYHVRGAEASGEEGPPWTVLEGVDVPLVLPARVLRDGEEPEVVVIAIPVRPAEVPDGFRFVSWGRHGPAPGPAGFLIGEEEITNDEYAEWLAELPEAARRRHLPARGFVELDGFPGVIEGMEHRPVEGIRPRDAVAYAEWRSETFEVVLRLPTAAEWARAASAGLDSEIRPLFASPLSPAAPGRLHPDGGPFGLRGLLTDPPEIATANANGGFVLMAASEGYGVSPDEGGGREGAPVAGAQRLGAGFRLVQPLP